MTGQTQPSGPVEPWRPFEEWDEPCCACCTPRCPAPTWGGHEIPCLTCPMTDGQPAPQSGPLSGGAA